VKERLLDTECRSVARVLRAAHDVHDRLCYLRLKGKAPAAVMLEANDLALKVSDEIIQPLEATEQESKDDVDVWDVLREMYTSGRLAGTTLDSIHEEYKIRVRAMEEKSIDEA